MGRPHGRALAGADPQLRAGLNARRPALRQRPPRPGGPDREDLVLRRRSPAPAAGRAQSRRESRRFHGDITPRTRLVRYEVNVRQVRRGSTAMGVANGRLYADDACVYVASDLRVAMIRPAA
ncbi:hypothetical protein [Phenylobacterium sp.]|uniref:hypothetical protein n=1 Tax=Phenylobacterium sp. TaxID=1871053 RepID=UPI002810F230|nr:hypothetical protein [Phenylobacterium sp.]